jgi:hypothetical protein
LAEAALCVVPVLFRFSVKVAGRRADLSLRKKRWDSGWQVLDPGLREQTVAAFTVLFCDFPARILFAE